MKQALIAVVLAVVIAALIAGYVNAVQGTSRTKKAGGEPTPKPSITITHVPSPGAEGGNLWKIAGEVRGVDVSQCKVIVFAKTDTWYVQPFTHSPYTSISKDGKWETDTHAGDEFAALLVRSSYKPPATTTMIPNVGGDVLAIATATAKGGTTVKTISFSGYEWIVKSSQRRVGPGPNYFSDSSDNVWVDDKGLHLKITRRDDRWSCAEVISKRSFGYGTYRFYLASAVDNLDPYVVLGLFTWSDDPAYSHREIDIECAKWGNASNTTNAQFVVQPYNRHGHLSRFQVPAGTETSTHGFTWKKDSVFFQSLKGHNATPPKPSDVIKQWTCTGERIPQAGGENARMNLWLVGGRAPKNDKEVEVIISKFEFVPSS